MRQPVGWIGLACLALLHCSSSVTDTRAPRAGMLFVSLPMRLGPTAIVRARRMERCDATGSAIACDASTPYCVSEALCGELLGPVADGQGVDIGIGMETAHPRGLVVTPGRIAVSVTVLPTLPEGAVCDERQAASLCTAGLVCNPSGIGSATARCGRPGARPLRPVPEGESPRGFAVPAADGSLELCRLRQRGRALLARRPL